MKKYVFLLLLSLFSVSSFAGQWVHARNGRIPYRAWQIGRDTNGEALFLCKARYSNSTIPGKIRSGFNGCHISYAGREIIRPRYRVFVGRPNGYWRRARRGRVPLGAWRVGTDSNGTALYLCRAQYKGLQIGKVRPGIGGCNIAYAGKERVLRRYQIFTR